MGGKKTGLTFPLRFLGTDGFHPQGTIHSNSTPLSPRLKIRMIREWNLSSLSSQTAKPYRWTREFSKQTHIYKGKMLALCKYFDCHPPIIKAVRLRTTWLRTPMESSGQLLSEWVREYMPETTPKSSALSQIISPRVSVSSAAGGQLHVFPNFSGCISRCLPHCLECHPHLTACSLHSGISPMAFTASTSRAHVARVVRRQPAMDG